MKTDKKSYSEFIVLVIVLWSLIEPLWLDY